MRSLDCAASGDTRFTAAWQGTGVVGTLRVGHGKTPRPAGDMDALPMQERSGKPWASQVDGRFHGCGHDGLHHHAALRG